MAGTVTNPTGSVKGNSLTGLQDCFTGWWSGGSGTYDGTTDPAYGGMAQAQHAVLLSNKPDACTREGQHGSAGYLSGELTLRLAFTVWADLPYSIATIPPAADLPLTYPANMVFSTSEGTFTHRVCTPYFMKAKAGQPGSDVQATGGTVTLTQADSGLYVGSYDLQFGSDQAAGSFSAPWC